MMEKKNIKYFASVCFAISLVTSIISCFENFSIRGLFPIVSWTLIVVALLSDRPILSAVAFAIRVFSNLYSIASCIALIIDGWISFAAMLLYIPDLVINILLMLASINPKFAKNFGIVAGMMYVAELAVTVILYATIGRSVPIASFIAPFLEVLLYAVEFTLWGLAFDNLSNKMATSETAITQNSNTPAQGTLEDSNIEKIMRLKSFLDDGVITQEEFDAKKKKFLGL